MDNNASFHAIFIIKFSLNCTDSGLGLPNEDVPVYMLVLSFIALLLNSFSLLIFWQQKNKSVMRTSLVLLSVTEIMFHTSNLMFYLFAYSNFVFIPKKYWEKVLLSVNIGIVQLSRDVFVCARNWCNLLISASRAEAIAFPLKTRKMFTRKKIIIILLVSSTIATIINTFRYLDFEMTICENPKPMRKFSTTIFMTSKPYVDSVYFTWQSGIPCITVIICTIIMISVLGTKNNANLPNFNNQRSRNQYLAIRTVLSLAIIFSIFELPSLIMTLFKFDNAHYISIGNTMVLLDSIFNFIVYTFSLPYFRSYMTQRFCCQKYREPSRSYSTSCDKKVQKKYINHSKCLELNHEHSKQLIITIETQI